MTERTTCRVCSGALKVVFTLGDQPLSGVFPLPDEPDAPGGPLDLAFCTVCRLTQLRHDFPLDKMYGDNYGYRSGLNKSMVRHIHGIVENIEKEGVLGSGDKVLDIGCNDGTLLNAYTKSVERWGVDPTVEKFREFHDEQNKLVADFFPCEGIDGKFKVITSLAMLYDLPCPNSFFEAIKKHLHHDGVWITEQADVLGMLKHTLFDSVCHEHLEYYAPRNIYLLAQKHGLKIVSYQETNTNGASFVMALRHKEHPDPECKVPVELPTIQDFIRFGENVRSTLSEVRGALVAMKSFDYKVYGYGASTKGNVLLNAGGIDTNLIEKIVEVNPDKFGRVTPGTRIPIVSESQDDVPDAYLVLPWHFKENILKKNADFLENGGRMIFPLPYFTIFAREER